jgi:fructose-bisphosphate aldolase/2-amino-3,7-dideoxy-D-threo-hept-6-ulosonate synthase
VQSLPPSFDLRIGIIVHLSASTGRSGAPDSKTLVSSVEEAIRLGADAVSVHVNIGSDTENEMLRDLGMVAGDCMNWGVPLLAMAYPRGPGIKNQYDVDVVKHAARVAAELGADIVKTNYTGTPEGFREVVKGCTVPVVIAGGPKMRSDTDLLKMVRESIDAGGAGVSIGRNVFQHPNVAGMTRAIARIVLAGLSVEDAYKEIGK